MNELIYFNYTTSKLTIVILRFYGRSKLIYHFLKEGKFFSNTDVYLVAYRKHCRLTRKVITLRKVFDIPDGQNGGLLKLTILVRVDAYTC